MKSEEFHNLTSGQLIELIKDDNLVVASEETVYEVFVLVLVISF